MCRLLLLYNPDGVEPDAHLEAFRQLSANSREYQGHGWGCAWVDAAHQWRLYHNIAPVWEDPKSGFPRTRMLLAHARSAFRDEGIAIENNMPFCADRQVFIFNGELRGVRIKAEGRIGAEKIFNTIRRFDHGDTGEAVRRAVRVIDKRTRYIRALNFFLAGPDSVHLCNWFNEDADYFQMRETEMDGTTVICSAPYPDSGLQWQPLPNHTLRRIVVL